MNEFKPLPLVSFKQAVDESEQYLIDRREGKITSLKTKFKKLNSVLMGGLEQNTITCISARSGCGKSTLAKAIRNSINELNNLPIYTFVFNFEMLAKQQIARELSTRLTKPLSVLYSTETRLSDEEFELVKYEYNRMRTLNPNIYFVEVSDNAMKIKNSLLHYYEKIVKPNKGILVYEIDHALLTKGKEGDSEKDKVDKLMESLVDLKKIIASDGGSSVGIVLSQMNRDIQSVERVNNPANHQPRSSDLFGSSSIEFAADYIIINHIPAKLGIKRYTELELPCEYIHRKNGQIIKRELACYLHLIKNRSGESDIIIPLENRLEFFDFEELPSEEFAKRHKQLKTSQFVYVNH
ncbi:MAG: DnaB helicase C-terminal domain-containing protein [Candidatus Dojkabacteria bacterium]|nr:DnaB helicase C-terminal domain-containing protein [Candidatus Dojkabacteria bacterium]